MLSTTKSEPLARRLAHLADEVERLLSTHQPQAAVVEKSFHGINSRSLIVLAEARGAILSCLGRHPIEIAEYSPAEVKAAVTGNGRADKTQVARMVQVILGLAGKPPRHDTTDALALALCFSQRATLDRLAALPR